MAVLLSGLFVLAFVAVVVAGNRRGQQRSTLPAMRWMGGVVGWAITVLGGIVAAVLVTRGVLDLINPSRDTAPAAAGAVLLAFGVVGVVLVIAARRR
jgi:hypothetical protein